MSRSWSRADSTTIGTLAPGAEPADHLDAVDPRQARGRGSTTSGRCSRRVAERLLAVGRRDHLVAAGAQVRAQATQDLRLVVDDQDPRHAASESDSTIVSPPPGVSSIDELAAHRLHEALRDREPEPHAVRRTNGRPALEGLEHPVAVAGGIPGPRSITRSSTRCAADAGRRSRTCSSAGVHAHRVAGDVGDRAFQQGGVDLDPRQGLRHLDLDRRAVVGEARERRRDHFVQAHRTRTRFSAPLWIRLMSSRLPTRTLRRSVSSSIVARNSPVSSSVHATSCCRRLLTDGLDRCQRGAQVVRHRLQDGGAQLVGLHELGGLGRLLAEVARPDGRGHVRREGDQDPPDSEGRCRRAAPGPRRRRARSGRCRPPAAVGGRGPPPLRSPNRASHRAKDRRRHPGRTCRGAAPAGSATDPLRPRAAARAGRGPRLRPGLAGPRPELERLGPRGCSPRTRRRRRRRSPGRSRPRRSSSVWIGSVKYQLTSSRGDRRHHGGPRSHRSRRHRRPG